MWYGGNAAYKCMASNSVGVRCSDYINFMVEGETTEFFEWPHVFVTNFNYNDTFSSSG